MSNYDDFLNNKTPAPKSKPKKKKNDRDLIWNVLTIVMLAAMFGSCGIFYSIYTNPNSFFNPMPPPPTATPTVTPTWTPIQFEATWTPKPTIPPTETFTPRPTFTLEPSITPFSLATPTPPATSTMAPTATRTVKPAGLPYSVTVSNTVSTTYRADTSCATMYVAGQALDNQQNPMLGYIVRMGGSLPGKTVDATTMTGIAFAYGQSGFEFDLGLQPVASKGTLWIQLFDQSNAPLSDRVFLTTFSDCNKNLIYVRFAQK